MKTIACTSVLAALLSSLVLARASTAVQGGREASGDSRGAAPGEASALFWGDLDGDGRLDALSITAEGRLRLLANRREGFEDVSERAGLGGIDAVALALWHDYDGDGSADLFVGRSAGASLLLRNEGGSFVDMAAGAGLAIEEPVRAAHWLDEDGDGRLDLHVVTSRASRVWRGLEGGFFEPVELPFDDARGLPTLGVGPLALPPEGAAAGPAGPAAGPVVERVDGIAPARPPAGGTQPIVGPPANVGGVTPINPFPNGCATSIRDQANPGTCLQASGAATLGMLYPLSSKLFVQEFPPRVGIGTTSPSYPLHVVGKIVSGTTNSAPGSFAAMCGGLNNQADGEAAAVGGGHQNSARGWGDTIGGGRENKTTSDLNAGGYHTIGGGSLNEIAGYYAAWNTIGGGANNDIGGDYNQQNTIGGGGDNYAGGYYGRANTVGGGSTNSAGGNFSAANTVGGGRNNVAGGFPDYSGSTVAGGEFNTATGAWAAIPGGGFNLASEQYSFAAGRRAKATHAGSFVWGDGQNVDKPSSAADQFNVYSEGGMRVFAAGVASPSMVVDSAGNVGIGTSAPLDALHVEGVLRSAGPSGGQVASYNPNNQNSSVTLSWLADVARIRVGGSGTGGQNGLDIQTQNDVSLMRLLHNGNVGIGTTSPGFDLEVNGTAGKPGGGSWSVSSDARLKKDVEDLEGALETLLALRGVSFEYIDPAAIGELDGRRIGFLAQEVERVLPDWVGEKEDGTKYLTIRGFEALAVEALRELERRNRELVEDGDAKDARIAELEQQGRALVARIAELEAVRTEVAALRAELGAPRR